MKYKVRITKQPRYQQGGSQDAQQQIMQVVKAYAQKSGVDPKTILLQLQKMQPEQQQQALQQMYAAVSGDQQDMGYEDQEEMQSAAYGGQMGYALDLGARRLWMNQDGDESSQVNDSIEEVPREDANIEAEGGETAMIPYKQGGAYMHKKIKGKRHTEGGVPLNVPEGTFIFSDTKKMKLGGSVLKLFGKSDKSSKKYTPADLAKQYNIDKYNAILNDPKSDPVAKRTAELMIQNYEKKLAQLALVQEGKKGYPQGIPQVAQNYYNQMLAASGQPNNESPEQKQFDNEQLEGQETMKAMYGMGFKYGGGLPRFQGNEDGSEVDITNLKPQPYTYDNPVIPDNNLQKSIDYTNNQANKDFLIVNTNDDEKPISSSEKVPQYNIDPSKKYTSTSYNAYTPYGWSTPDKLNMLNSMINMASIKKYTPFEPTMKFSTPETYYADPSRALAANAEQMNAARQAAAMFAGPQSRYSFNAGQYGKNAADIIGQYATQNIGIANTAAQQRAATQNQQMQYDAQRAKRLYDAGVIGEQQYQNAMRQARAAALQSYTQGYKNASTLYNINKSTSDDYYIDHRTEKMMFKSPEARERYFTKKRATANSGMPSIEELEKKSKETGIPLQDLLNYHKAMNAYRYRRTASNSNSDLGINDDNDYSRLNF